MTRDRRQVGRGARCARDRGGAAAAAGSRPAAPRERDGAGGVDATVVRVARAARATATTSRAGDTRGNAHVIMSCPVACASSANACPPCARWRSASGSAPARARRASRRPALAPARAHALPRYRALSLRGDRPDLRRDGRGAERGHGKEMTSVYARVLDEHLERAFDVMAQMSRCRRWRTLRGARGRARGDRDV